MLHILNGDATAAAFAAAGLPGDRMVWREVLVEGPVAAGDGTPESREARAAWLAERLGIDGEAYGRAVREQAEGLAAAPEHDEVVLWFEQDLFCAVNLWSVLDWFARHAPVTRLSLVYPEIDVVKGLGAMPAAQLAALFAERRPVTEAMRAMGHLAWTAYAGADPLGSLPLSTRETSALPFVQGAFRCHLGRFPSVANGLNEVETAALAVLRRGPRPFGDLFRDVTAHLRVRRHGMGDVQFAACVRGLAPMVSAIGGEAASADLEITPIGRDVVAGDRDRLEIQSIDTWLGGVHLRGDRPRWRWDGARGRLVTAS
jgi:hypothetical protein